MVCLKFSSVMSLMILIMTKIGKIIIIFLSNKTITSKWWNGVLHPLLCIRQNYPQKTCVTCIKPSFEVVMPKSIKKVILEMTNLEGRCVLGESGRSWMKYIYMHNWRSSSWLRSVSQRMNQQPVGCRDRQEYISFFGIIWSDNRETRGVRQETDTHWQLLGQCWTNG